MDLNLVNFEGFYKREINPETFARDFKIQEKIIAPYSKITCINSLLNHKNQIFTEAHCSIITQIIYCPAKNIIVTADLGTTLRVWDYSTKLQLCQRYLGKVENSNFYHEKSALVALSQNSDFIISPYQGNEILIWFYRENKSVFIASTSNKINSLFLSRNDEVLISTSNRGLFVNEMKSYKVILNINELKADFITDVSENGKIATIYKLNKNLIHVYDSITGKKELKLKQHYSNPVVAKLNQRGDLLAIAYKNNKIVIWDLKKQEVQSEITDHMHKIQFMTFDSNSSHLISGGLDSFILFWSLETDSIENRIEVSKLGCSSCALLEDHNCLAVGYQNNTLKFINLSNIEDVFTAPGHSDQVLSLAISKSYKKLASGSHDKMIIIWNIENKGYSNIVNAHESCVNCLTFSNNEEFLVSGGMDMVVKVWNCESLEMICRFDEHDLRIEQVYVSPDDKLIVSASGDYKFRLWEIGEGCTGFAYFDELYEKIRCFSKSKKYLIVSSKLKIKIIKFVNFNKVKQLLN